MASDTASTIPPTRPGPRDPSDPAAAVTPTGEEARIEAEAAASGAPDRDKPVEHTGSLGRRMMLIAAGWITILLLVGGLALDRTITNLLERNLDERLNYILTSMVGSAEIDAEGDVWFNRVLGDQRFLEPNSGLYWQIDGTDKEPWPSRSLWDRTLTLRSDHTQAEPVYYNSDQFEGETPSEAEVGEERLRPFGLADRRPAVYERHQVEVGADHAGVVAAGDGAGVRDVGVGQGLEDAVLPEHRLVAPVGDPGRWPPECPALPATCHLEQLVGGPAGHEPAVDGFAPAGEPLPVEPGPEAGGIDELSGPLCVCV